MPDETVVCRAARCQYCQSALADADQTLDARYDKIDLPKVRPMVTRAARIDGGTETGYGCTGYHMLARGEHWQKPTRAAGSDLTLRSKGRPMPIILPHGTTLVANLTPFTISLLLNGHLERGAIEPSDEIMIKEFNEILVQNKETILHQNPDEQVEIPTQTPRDVITLRSQDGLSFTLPYRATDGIKTIQFTQ
jgi:hypothetical protein